MDCLLRSKNPLRILASRSWWTLDRILWIPSWRYHVLEKWSKTQLVTFLSLTAKRNLSFLITAAQRWPFEIGLKYHRMAQRDDMVRVVAGREHHSPLAITIGSAPIRTSQQGQILSGSPSPEDSTPPVHAPQNIHGVALHLQRLRIATYALVMTDLLRTRASWSSPQPRARKRPSAWNFVLRVLATMGLGQSTCRTTTRDPPSPLSSWSDGEPDS